MSHKPERDAPPHAAFALARSPAVPRLLWSLWGLVGLGLMAAFSWLWHAGDISTAQQWPAGLAALVTWLLSGAALWRSLRSDAHATATLHQRLGAWTLQRGPQTEELPCEIRLLIDMQHALLLRLKDGDSWHWLWLNAPAPQQRHSKQAPARAHALPPDSAWMNLRRALVASTPRP